jgi:hypothetical protein
MTLLIAGDDKTTTTEGMGQHLVIAHSGEQPS